MVESGLDVIESWESEILMFLRPPPDVSTAQWAEQSRIMPSGLTQRSGKWRNEVTPYGVGIMDAMDDPETTHVIVMKSSQMGVTEFSLNAKGKRISNDPCPIMFIRPTIQSAQEYSKTRFNPMWESTPEIRAAIKPPRSRDSDNQILFKQFTNGFLYFGGANSPSSLKSRAARFIIFDEVDEFELDIKGQGDVIEMVERRAASFFDPVFVLISTPTIRGMSRIEAAFEEGNKQYWCVPCLRCGEFDRLRWSSVKWNGRLETIQKKAASALYECPYCSYGHDDSERWQQTVEGKWIAEAPDVLARQSFHLNFLANTWTKLSDKVETFLKVKGIPERRKVFYNQDLGESYEEKGETIDPDKLTARREDYDSEVPKGCYLLVGSVDVQVNRLECTCWGWGHSRESWVIEHKIIYGDPRVESGDGSPWEDLAMWIDRQYEHESGIHVRMACIVVDAGAGEHTGIVARFCKQREARRVYPIKGSSSTTTLIISPPRKANRWGVVMFNVNVHICKLSFLNRLKIEEHGPGYVHLPRKIDVEFCSQLTAEELKTKYKNGFPVKVFTKMRDRNEALDLAVYADAAYHILAPDMDAVERSFAKRVEEGSRSALDRSSRKNKPFKSWARRGW